MPSARSAAYAARWVAKNIVAAGLADRCEVQVAYAIGVARPLSVNVETFGTSNYTADELVEIINANFDLRPGAIIRDLDLRRPIYRQTAAYGVTEFNRHFRYSCLHSHFLPLQHCSRYTFAAVGTLLYHSTNTAADEIRSFGTMLRSVHFRRPIARLVSYYALFKGWLLLSQPPNCLCD